MRVHHGIADIPKFKHAIVTSGTFDGVHLGHQKILQRLQQIAFEERGETVLITFWPHPRLVFGQSVELISTLDEKTELLERNGIDHLIVIPFTKEFSLLSPEEFIQKIYIKALHTKKLVIGYDHHFGKNRAGSFEYLQKNLSQYSFEIEEIPRQDIEDVGISSTKIRNAIKSGDIATANQYLARPYSFSGKVVNGNKIGRTIGFPTANIEVNTAYKLIPAEGIYAVNVLIENSKYEGMLYIGKRPTIDHQLESKIEVNIFNFDATIYGKDITVQMVDYIRADQKFDNLSDLSQQLAKDKEATQLIFAHKKSE